MTRKAPEPSFGQVLVRVQANGLCVSDLPSWQEGQPGAGTVLGHEPVGTVAQAGPGVDLPEGSWVTGRFTASYADFVLADIRDVVEVPDGVPVDQPLGEPLGCVMEALRRTPIHLADRVAVVGLGFMGLCMVQVLTRTSAARVSAIDLREDARNFSLITGADDAYHPADLPGHLRGEHGSGIRNNETGVDVVIEATGTQRGLDLATTLVRPHGRISILGYHQSTRQVDLPAWNWKAIDVVNAHVRDRELLRRSTRAGLEMIAAGRIDLTPLVTHRYPLDQVDRAFAVMEEKPAGFVKAIIEMK